MIRQSGNDHLTLLEKVLADTKPTRTNFLLARAFLLKHYGVARKQTIDSLARILDYLMKQTAIPGVSTIPTQPSRRKHVSKKHSAKNSKDKG